MPSIFSLQISPTQNVSKFCLMIEYFLSMVFEMYIPCYYCTLVSSISAKLPVSIYNSNWLWQSLKFKRTMRIMVSRSLKPVRTIVSGGLFEVGLPTFLLVSLTTYMFILFAGVYIFFITYFNVMLMPLSKLISG